MFALKSPCDNCPFRRGQGQLFGLSPRRLEDIREATAFQCHKTIEIVKPGAKPQQCAGLMAVLRREDHPNAIMKAGVLFGHLDPLALDPRNEAYGSWAEVLAAHRGV